LLLLVSISLFSTGDALAKRVAPSSLVAVAADPRTVPESDSMALVDLYNATNGDNWYYKDNWLTGRVDTWYGVYLRAGRVISLWIPQNDLQGELPPSLGNLDALLTLNLRSNQLSGDLPDELGNLTKLEVLYLYNNSFSSGIPGSFSQLVSLRSLDLTSSGLGGPIPDIFDNMKALQGLWLSYNGFLGEIPNSFGSLTALNSLELTNCSLDGPIPDIFGQLNALSSIKLSYNQLSGGLPPSLLSMPDLSYLWLNDNQLSGPLPAELGNVTTFSYLDLSNNQFTSLPLIQSNPFAFYVASNRFTFESLEANIGKFGSPSDYAPQDSVGEAANRVLVAGQSLELSALVGGANNRYQWTKNGVEISGANQPTLTVAEAGTYGCSITNTVVTGLTLHRRKVHVSVESPADCQASGTILREYWAKVNGNQTINVPVNKAPTSISYLTSFEGPTGVGENYASRIRGYLCAPETGNYTFWIASDDYGDLYLSSDDNPANKQLIAWIKGWSNPRQWNKHYSQKSALIYLEKGKRYYIEALHKQAWVNDNLSVAWRLSSSPASASPVVIPGSVLSPFVPGNARLEYAEVANAEAAAGLNLQAAPNPFTHQTTVTFTARESGPAVLDLYDLQGKKLQRVFEAEVQAGEPQQAQVNGSRLGQGLYLLRLVNGSRVQHLKALVNQ